jgi:hypothetical protein
MVVVTRAEAARIADAKGPLAKVVSILQTEVTNVNLNTISRAPPAIRELIIAELQGADGLYKDMLDTARLRTEEDVNGIHALSRTLFGCLDKPNIDERTVRACFDQFRAGVRAVPRATKNHHHDAVDAVVKTGLSTSYLGSLINAWVKLLWKTNAREARTVVRGITAALTEKWGMSTENARLFFHVATAGAFQLNGVASLPTNVRVYVTQTGSFTMALFTNTFWAHLHYYLDGLKTYVPQNVKNRFGNFAMRSISGLLSVMSGGAGKISLTLQRVLPTSLYFSLLLQVGVYFFQNNPRLQRMAWGLTKGIFKYIICKPIDILLYKPIVTSLQRRLQGGNNKKKNTTCPNPKDIFSVSVEKSSKNKNTKKNTKNEKNTRALVTTAPGPTLFIVRPDDFGQMTAAEKRLRLALLDERDGPEHRGASTYEITEAALKKAGLDVLSGEFPYAIMYDTSGAVLHASRQPREVYKFLLKSPVNFGLTKKKLKSIRNRIYPNKSVRNVLNIEYTALKKNVKPTNANNLNRAYRIMSKKV